MSAVIVWLMIISGPNHRVGMQIVKFSSEHECMAAASKVQSQSEAKKSFPYLGAICVPAKGVL